MRLGLGPGLVEPKWLKALQGEAVRPAPAMRIRKNWWEPQLEFARQKTSGEHRITFVEGERSRPAEAVELDTEPAVDMEFEMEHKEFEIQRDMEFGIVYTTAEKVCTVFETAGKESEARRGVSGSTDRAFVEEHKEPGYTVAEEKGEVAAGKWDVVGDEVGVGVYPAADIYSAVERGRTYTAVAGTYIGRVRVVEVETDYLLNAIM